MMKEPRGPINISPGTVILWGGSDMPPASQRPTLAANLGIYATEWGALESILALLFATLLGVDMRVSTGILDRILSMQQKLGILRFTVRYQVGDENKRAALSNLLDEVKSLTAKRNDLIHGRWGVSKTYPDHLIWAKNTFEPNIPQLGYDEAEFQRLIGKVRQVRNDIQIATVDIASSAIPRLEPKPQGEESTNAG